MGLVQDKAPETDEDWELFMQVWEEAYLYLAPLRIDPENLKIWVIRIPDFHEILSLNQGFWFYTE